MRALACALTILAAGGAARAATPARPPIVSVPHLAVHAAGKPCCSPFTAPDPRP